MKHSYSYSLVAIYYILFIGVFIQFTQNILQARAVLDFTVTTVPNTLAYSIDVQRKIDSKYEKYDKFKIEKSKIYILENTPAGTYRINFKLKDEIFPYNIIVK